MVNAGVAALHCQEKQRRVSDTTAEGDVGQTCSQEEIGGLVKSLKLNGKQHQHQGSRSSVKGSVPWMAQ